MTQSKRGLTLRQVAGAWIVGGSIWMLGMGGLVAFPLYFGDAVAAAEQSAPDYYEPAGSWRTYQDASGRYTVTVRAMVPVTR